MDPKLYEAAMKGDITLLQASSSSNNLHSHRTPTQDTVLHIATQFHQTAFAKAALEGCPPLLWQANSANDTPLHVAAGEDHADLVEFFINFAQSVDEGTGESRQLREVMRMVNLEKDTALHCAARRGSKRCVELLAKADPEVCGFVNDANESPLYLCVASGYRENHDVIIKYSTSSASHKGPNGLTALHSTLFFSNYTLESIEPLVKWRREMIREGDNLGLTPLHYAALYGHIEATKLFLQYDSSTIYLLDNNGDSALHFAAIRGHINVLKELINFRPDCYNMINIKGQTALHVAVLNDQREAVKFILETPRFASLINKPDKDGNTPLHLAAHFKLYGMIEILAKNEKVSSKTINKEFLTPFEVYNKHREEGLRAEVARSNLKGSRHVMAMQRYVEAQVKKMNQEPANATDGTTTTTSTNNHNKKGDHSMFGEQNALEVNLLVATLVATVTFAAGFTMPGGFVNNGENEGLAIHTKKAAFQVFVVFNTLAFCCSVFAVLLQFHTSLSHYRLRVRYMGIAAFSTTIAILAMVLAFSSGSYVVLTKSIGLSVAPYAICGCFVIVYLVIPLADPSVEGFPCINRLQNFVRGIIIRYM